MIEVNISGLSDLQKILDELPAKIEANVLRGGLKAGAKVIEAEAKRLVPTDTGRLRDSIRVSTRTRAKAGWLNVHIKAGDDKVKKVVTTLPNGKVRVTYTNPWYARLVEFGTARHYIKATTVKGLILRPNKRASSGFARRWMSFVIAGVDHPGARAKPFMRPAFDAKHREALQTMADYMRTRLPREVKKFLKS